MSAETGEQGAVAGLAGVVLAAGAGTRFGGPKQLARIDGDTLVVRAARLAIGCCPAGVVVVTGAWAAEVAAALADVPVRLAHNTRWSEGMAASIRCGVEALPARASALLVLLCDQAGVTSADLQRLIGAWVRSPARVAAADYGAALAVPAIFPAAYWPQLCRLHGDRGARSLIAALPDVIGVPVPSALRDIDTPGDLDPAGG